MYMLKIKVPLVNVATLLVYRALPDLFVPHLALAGTIEGYSVSEALECYNLGRSHTSELWPGNISVYQSCN